MKRVTDIRKEHEDTSIEELLSAYIDGELAPQERGLVESLLQSDESAPVVLEEIKHTKELLASLPRKRAPRPFTLSEEEKKPGFFKKISWKLVFSAVAAIIVAVIGLGVFMSMNGGMSASPAPTQLAAKPTHPPAPLPTREARALAAPAPAGKGPLRLSPKGTAEKPSPGIEVNLAASPTPTFHEESPQGKRKTIPYWIPGMAALAVAAAAIAVWMKRRNS